VPTKSMKKNWDKVLLIGFRGSGKTTIGKLLAERLSLSFLDLDEEIQRRVGLTIKEMVERYGWNYFRERERESLEDLMNKSRCVVALGGGSVLHADLMEKLKERALIIYLKISAETAVKRIERDPKTEHSRPSLSGLSLEEEAERVLKERVPLYERYADIIIDTDKETVEEVLTEILEQRG